MRSEDVMNHIEKDLFYEQQIDHIEDEIRLLQVEIPVSGDESMSPALALLDDLFIQLHSVIALKCITMIDPENTLIVEAIMNRQKLTVLDVAKIVLLMTQQIESLHETLIQLIDDAHSTAKAKLTISEFFIARQVLVDTVISESSEADFFHDCSVCLQSTFHQFTATFDYACTQCETPLFK